MKSTFRIFIIGVVLTMSTLACSPPPPTPELTATLLPTTTPTPEPTATPTEIPTPTVNPEPTVWEIAQRMLAECAGAHSIFDAPSTQQGVYATELRNHIYQLYPDFDPDVPGGLWATSAGFVLKDDGKNQTPFSFVDELPEKIFDSKPMVPETTVCEGYVLAYDAMAPENKDGDGILVGEAYLFYEVGGTEPYVLDGELREVRFIFPAGFTPAVSLEEEAGRIALQNCLAVFPTDLENEELDYWTNQYLDKLAMEALGENRFHRRYELFLLSKDSLTCLVVFYQDMEGEEFLIYETAAGVVKVPFAVPSAY